MWLATKVAARRKGESGDSTGPRVPPMHVRQNQLGLEGAIEYRQLFEKHPDVELGPDETLEHHLSRLRAAEKVWGESPSPDADRRKRAREEGKLRPLEPTESDPDMASWVTQQGPTDLKGMPQRIPGWYTGDALDAPPPGYGIPPTSRRDPGATLRSPVSPTHAPPQRSMQD
jgi:hypothetical protein